MRISDWSSDVCSSDLLGLSSWIRVAGPEAARGTLLVHGRKHTDVRHKDVPPSPSNAALHRAHVQCGAVEPRHHVTVNYQLRALIAPGLDALPASRTLPAAPAPPDFAVHRPKAPGQGTLRSHPATQRFLALPYNAGPLNRYTTSP